MKRRLMTLWAGLFIGIGLLQAQTPKVTGVVLSEEDGQPVVGATVLVKGTTIGVATDVNGKFAFSELPASARTLVVSFVGMVTQEVAVKPQLKIVLKVDRKTLDEVMVVAFGTAKRSSFTGSAVSMKSEKIAMRQTSNVANVLSGQMAGVQMTSTDGRPGSKPHIRIRGIGSMSAGNEPLYVVDGAPFEGGIETINPQDIESMTVLKDAASNALYGARGANGVVLITTKKGMAGAKTQIVLDAKWGTNRRAIPNYDVMTDPKMYYETYYKGLAFAGNPDPGKATEKALAYPIFNLNGASSLFTPEGKIDPRATVGNEYSYGNNSYYLMPDDWYDEIFDANNLRQEYNLRISGASDRMTYYLSAGFLDDSGIIPNSGFQRFSARTNVEYQVNKRLRIGANLSYSNSKNNSPKEQEGSSSGNMFFVTNLIAPIYPLYVRNQDKSVKIDEHGFKVYDFGAGEYQGLGRPYMGNSNPASLISLDKQRFVYDVAGARAFASVDIIEGLSAKANWAFDLDNTRYTNKYNAYYGQYAGETGGIIYVGATRTYGVNQQYLLTYNKKFGEHNIDVMAGFESYDYKYQELSGSKKKLYNPNISEINNAIMDPQVNSSSNNYSTEGILARLQYNFAEKYFGSVSYRRDASSRFHPDNRWGDFWSAGAGWLLNKEAFLAEASWIDMLKFKISYGVQGNDNIYYETNPDVSNYYPYQDQYVVENVNDNFALSMTYKGNKDLTWETSKSFNTGFDFELFGNRLGGTVEYFSRKTTDMLYNRPVPSSLGYSSYPMNVGSMLNSGVELDLHGDIIRRDKLTLSMNFNLTHVKNEIKKLAPELNGELLSGSRIYQEGKSMYQLYLRKYAGVDHDTGQALYYKDVTDGNGNVTGQETTPIWSEATRYASGDILPKVYGGFGLSLETHGFDFNIGLAYQLGGKIYDNTYASLMHEADAGGAGTNWHKDILNAWTPDNKDSNIPVLNYNGRYANSQSDRFVTKSDYLSINSITLGYTIPKHWFRETISNLRLYLAAENVAVFSARKGLDPRQGYTSSGNDSYSPIRSISGGLSFTF